MARTDWDDDDDNEGGNDVASLRKAYNKLKAELADAQKKLGDYVTKEKRQTVAEVLKTKELPAGLAKWIERDLEEVTPEAVETWLTENADVFGFKPADAEPSGESTVSQDDQAALRRMASADTGSAPMAGEAAQLAALQGATSQADLLKVLGLST